MLSRNELINVLKTIKNEAPTRLSDPVMVNATGVVCELVISYVDEYLMDKMEDLAQTIKSETEAKIEYHKRTGRVL